jgi:hypothetical protein
MSGPATRSLAGEDINDFKILKDCVICTSPLPRHPAATNPPKAQIQTIDGPHSIHDGYTKSDISCLSKDDIFYARAIVYYKEAAEAHIPGLDELEKWGMLITSGRLRCARRGLGQTADSQLVWARGVSQPRSRQEHVLTCSVSQRLGGSGVGCCV